MYNSVRASSGRVSSESILSNSDGSESDLAHGLSSDSDNGVHLITFPEEKKEKIKPENLSDRIANVLVKAEEEKEDKYKISATKHANFKKSEYYLEDDNFLNIYYKASEKKGSLFLGKGQFAQCFKLVLNRKDPDTGEIDNKTKVDIPKNNYLYKEYLDDDHSTEIRVCCKKVDFKPKKKKNKHMTDEDKIKEELEKQDHENEFIRELQNLLTITSRKQKHARRQDGAIMIQADHVMGCIGIYFKNDNYLLMTEFFNKGSLENWLKSESEKTVRDHMKLTWNKMIDFSKQITLGLMFLEKCSIVHRDIAPRNICIHEPGNDEQILKIIDFGLARIIEPESGTSSGYFQDQKKLEIRKLPVPITPVEIITNSYGFKGNPWSKAERGAFTYKSDIWALGVLMYEMSIYCRYDKNIPKGFHMPFAKEVSAYYLRKVLKRPSSEGLTATDWKNFRVKYSILFSEFLAPNYKKHLYSLGEVDVYESSKAHAYTNKKNRIVLRSDMPKSLSKLIKSTWKLIDERPDAAQMHKELWDISKSEDKNLDAIIEIEEPSSSFSCYLL